MSHTPNRLEDHWPKLQDLIKEEWPDLSQADLEEAKFQFDKLVEIIRFRYGGRAEIIQEARIRDRLNNMLAKLDSHRDS